MSPSRANKNKVGHQQQFVSQVPALLVPIVPPGLGYLTYVEQLTVSEMTVPNDVVSAWDARKQYHIKNAAGKDVFFAVELRNDFGCTPRSSRPFNILVLDHMGVVVLQINRPFRGECLALCGSPQEVQVASGTGQLLGSFVEEWQCCTAKFEVKDPSGENALLIKREKCVLYQYEIDFRILTVDDEAQIGSITRKVPGVTNWRWVNVFSVHFPLDLDVAQKALLLAGSFLIDYVYYAAEANYRYRYNNNTYVSH